MAEESKPDEQIWLGAVVADLRRTPRDQVVSIRCTKFKQGQGWQSTNEYERQDLLDLIDVASRALESLASH